MYRAHCAVIFAIAQLSCLNMLLPEKFIDCPLPLMSTSMSMKYLYRAEHQWGTSALHSPDVAAASYGTSGFQQPTSSSPSLLSNDTANEQKTASKIIKTYDTPCICQSASATYLGLFHRPLKLRTDGGYARTSNLAGTFTLEKMEHGRIQGLPICWVPPIISGTGKATYFKFWRNIHRVDTTCRIARSSLR